MSDRGLPRPPAPPVIDVARISVLLCDADGILFPSEEPAFEASVTVTNRLLTRLGSTHAYTADEVRQVALGRNFRVFADGLAREHGVELARAELEDWIADEAAVVTRHLAATLRPDQRTREAVRELARRFRLAVVSSSALPRLDACFTATGLDHWFPPGHRFSAQDSLPVPSSKPDPAVYLHALDVLGVEACRALAIEDAVAGVASASAAGIPVVGNLAYVPPQEHIVQAAALRDAGAAAVVEDWEELTELLAPVAAERP